MLLYYNGVCDWWLGVMEELFKHLRKIPTGGNRAHVLVIRVLCVSGDLSCTTITVLITTKRV